MHITNPAYIQQLTQLKENYKALRLYKRVWFNLSSFRLSRALSAIDLKNPRSEQIERLLSLSVWFCKSIFGLLEQFKKSVKDIPFVKENAANEALNENSNEAPEQPELILVEEPKPIFEENPFEQLPQELNREIASRLASKELLSLSLASKAHSAFFNPMLHIRKFLHHVVRGDYEEVQVMLKNDVDLIYKKGRVTDCSGRTFLNVSAFQYSAVWARDTHMRTFMLECLPKNEEGRLIKAKLFQQGKEEISYKDLEGKIITESHFDFKNTIIKELQAYIDLLNTNLIIDWEYIDKQWIKNVGGAQRLLPMHVVYEYCSDVPFYPVPDFTKPPAARTKQFYNWPTEKWESWFGGGSRLGDDFAIYKGAFAGAWRVAVATMRTTGAAVAMRDLAAMTALCEVRTNDLINFMTELEKELVADHSQPLPLQS